MTDDPKARTLANGIEVWCSFEKLVPASGRHLAGIWPDLVKYTMDSFAKFPQITP